MIGSIERKFINNAESILNNFQTKQRKMWHKSLYLAGLCQLLKAKLKRSSKMRQIIQNLSPQERKCCRDLRVQKYTRDIYQYDCRMRKNQKLIIFSQKRLKMKSNRIKWAELRVSTAWKKSKVSRNCREMKTQLN